MNRTAVNKLYLVCNAHIDPVWLWNWEEGLAEALSTFRMAARLCDEFPDFVFCHNEALLYQWTEQHDPGLFEKIGRLVAERKWHVMGGWYLQPDCNLPSGESLVRQVLIGKRYFLEKFGVEPTVAVNLDPFGHTRGLVQILRKSGCRGYLFCRPGNDTYPLAQPDFIWVGYDGSQILCHRPPDHYNSVSGKAAVKVRKWLAENGSRPVGLLLWGVGNHGGGASREDLSQISLLQAETTDCAVEHATPEEYFDWLQTRTDSLEKISGSLNPWAVGCYTTMARVKVKHRRLENFYFMTERMATDALLLLGTPYPQEELQQALKELLFSEFHDSLPGSSVAEVEEAVIQKLDYGLEILAQVRAGIFLKFLAGQPEAGPGEFPIFVYNPHPHESEEIIVCEFQPQEPNFDADSFWVPELRDPAGNTIPVQLEKESCNIVTEQRKRVVFPASLRASHMHRFSCRLRKVPAGDRGAVRDPGTAGRLMFKNDACCVEINRNTGLIDRYAVQGVEVLDVGAPMPIVIKDDADPWGMRVQSFGDVAGTFRLMTAEEAAGFAGIDASALAPVRVIEQGCVRTVVEALFIYGCSRICIRYRLPAHGSEIEIEARVFWEEKNRMLKLSLPSRFHGGACFAQSAYGMDRYAADGKEGISHQWLALQSADGKSALTVINDRTSGFDFSDGELRLSLLRSPAYAGHPVDAATPIVRQDRFEARIDQGEHRFLFWLNCGPARERFAAISKEAACKNAPFLALCAFPSGAGEIPAPGIRLSNPAIQLGAWKLSEDGRELIFRVFETAGRRQSVHVTIPALALEHPVDLDAFELKSFAVDRTGRSVREVDLLEREHS